MNLFDFTITKKWHKWWSPSESGAVGGLLASVLASLVFGCLLLAGFEALAWLWIGFCILFCVIMAYIKYKALVQLRKNKP